MCRVANQQARLPRATSSLALNASRDGEDTEIKNYWMTWCSMLVISPYGVLSKDAKFEAMFFAFSSVTLPRVSK